MTKSRFYRLFLFFYQFKKTYELSAMASKNLALVCALSAFSVFSIGAAKAGSDVVQEFEVARFEEVHKEPLDLQVLKKFLASL